jgi:predicted esterase
MKYYSITALLIMLLFSTESCIKSNHNFPVIDSKLNNKEQISLFDSTRNRVIPVAFYFNKNTKYLNKLIIVNHGYGFNKPDSYLQYTYLCDSLSQLGFDLASIQHELPNDSLLPLEGNPMIERMPFWKNGAENILCLIDYLKSELEQDFYQQISLIGHSNGGDISILFAQLYPEEVNKVITLDHRRMPIKPDSLLPILSLRSNDQTADQGVIPEQAILALYPIQITYLDSVGHNDMDDTGNRQQKQQILREVIAFLLKD